MLKFIEGNGQESAKGWICALEFDKSIFGRYRHFIQIVQVLYLARKKRCPIFVATASAGTGPSGPGNSNRVGWAGTS